MTQGDIVLVVMPQKDGQKKKRPALVLKQMEPFKDCLVCGISSQLRHEVKGFDILIHQDDECFHQTGLKSTSLIRLGYITTIALNRIPGIIGRLDEKTLKKVIDRLTNFIKER